MDHTSAPRIETRDGIMALGNDREATLAVGRKLAGHPEVSAVAVHLAEAGQDRHFTAALRAVGPPEMIAEAAAPVASTGLWRAEFRHVKDSGCAVRPDEPVRGVGLVFGIWRHPDLDFDAFDAHWRDIHAPLAVKHHVGMWDYVQCSFRGALKAGGADYDAVAICQFPSLHDMNTRFFPDAEAERAIGEDVVRFGDPGRLARVRMVEYRLR